MKVTAQVPPSSALTVSRPSEQSQAAQGSRAKSRRGHVKSRQGCFSCKRRRVKCDERRPVCSPCRRLHLSCEFPPEMVPAPQGSISSMAMDHLRFYHRFLHVAYPSLPVREHAAWQSCALLSHEYEFLSHAVLALGAAHSIAPGFNYTTQALYHRATAMRLANEQLSNPDGGDEVNDALLGTMLCLGAQSSSMLSTFDEYLTLIRGCTMVAERAMRERKTDPIWRSISVEMHNEALDAVIMPKAVDEDTAREVKACQDSLDRLLTQCQTEQESHYQSLIRWVVDGILVGDYKRFSFLLVQLSSIDMAAFNDFTRPDNWVARALIVHKFMVSYLVGGYFLPVSEARATSSRKAITITWIQGVAQRMPKAYLPLLEWPLQYCETLKARDGRNMFCP